MSYYVAGHCDPSDDSYISPILTPDWVLKEYPETFIGIAEYDPLRDDAFRFGNRLLKLEKETQLIYVRFVRHDPIMYTMPKSPLMETFKYLEMTNVFMERWLIKRRHLEQAKGDPSLKSGIRSERIKDWLSTIED